MKEVRNIKTPQKVVDRLQLNGIMPISVIIGQLGGMQWNEKISKPIQDCKATQVLNLKLLSETGRKYEESDRVYRTIGNRQEFNRNWVGHRTHDFFLHENIITVEYGESRMMEFYFENEEQAASYYAALTGFKTKSLYRFNKPSKKFFKEFPEIVYENKAYGANYLTFVVAVPKKYLTHPDYTEKIMADMIGMENGYEGGYIIEREEENDDINYIVQTTKTLK